MKKLLSLLVLTFAISVAATAQDDKTKVKATSTIPQKVHNTVSRDTKYKGYKTRQKQNGRTKKHKVDLKNNEEKVKGSN